MEMQNKQREIHDLQTSCFGLQTNPEITNKMLSKHMKQHVNVLQLEEELNKLAAFCFQGDRKVVWHEFRNFPYIYHNDGHPGCDEAGLLTNYTSADFYFIRFVKNYIYCTQKGYNFLDVDFLLKNAKRCTFYEESIANMAADVIFKHI